MNTFIADRLASLPNFSDIQRNELEWLAENGHFEVYDKGTIVAPKNKPVYKLYIILSGIISIRVDYGVGAKQVEEWLAGEVTGMLPYSRMTGPPGDNYAKEKTETLSIFTKLFPVMITQCPSFTAYTVHSMLDRARNFNTNALQDEKMISLGKLAAGLSHELNNPASAAVRNAKLIKEELLILNETSYVIGSAGLKETQLNTIKKMCTKCLNLSENKVLSPIQKADFQDELNNWLFKNKLDTSLALKLADTSLTITSLNMLVSMLPYDTLDAVLRWIIAIYTVHSLAMDIDYSSSQIYKLVNSFKKFTFMDNLADNETTDVEIGIRDTLNVLVSKIKSINANINIELEANLPKVQAKGSELNQVWLSLIDNALDVLPLSGKIDITACSIMNRVEVRIIDNGPGIPKDKISRVFDAFFTTKPQGHGVGLGLDLARRILQRYRGEIYVQSNPGHTEFIVSLKSEDRSK